MIAKMEIRYEDKKKRKSSKKGRSPAKANRRMWCLGGATRQQGRNNPVTANHETSLVPSVWTVHTEYLPLQMFSLLPLFYSHTLWHFRHKAEYQVWEDAYNCQTQKYQNPGTNAGWCNTHQISSPQGSRGSMPTSLHLYYGIANSTSHEISRWARQPCTRYYYPGEVHMWIMSTQACIR